MSLLKAIPFLILFVACGAHAGGFDVYQLINHKTSLAYISDNTFHGSKAYSYYYNFNALSYDGSNHNYLKEKYKPKFREIELGFATALSETLVLTTNFRTGQRSEKLTIDPALKIGFIKIFGIAEENSIYRTGGYSYFSVGFSHIFGGNTKEKSCKDDFDKEYNCRTALSVVDTPTLQEKPRDKYNISLKWNLVKDFL